MVSDDSFLSLSRDFADADRVAWRSMVEQSLKGRVFEECLVSRLREGIAVQPVYTGADQLQDDDDRLGLVSLLSAHGPINRLPVRQICDNPQLEAAGRDIERDLKGGADCLVLVWGRAGQTINAVGPGLNIGDLDDLDCLLKAVDLAAIPLALEAGPGFLPASALVLAYYQRRMGSLEGARIDVNADPLAVLARDGVVSCGLGQALDDMADLAVMFEKNGSGLVAVGVDSRPYSDAGADAAQELGCLIATGLSYIKALTQRSLSLESANRQIAFTLSSDADIFLNIAKFRAARMLWARVISAAGGNEASMPMTLNACTATRMLTRRDPWVNILRSTVAAFAAGIGGADAMTVHSFDSVSGISGTLGRRIARNIPIILSEESGISQVADPAAGSWYVERLTRQLAEAAWSQFQWIESYGGMVAAMRDGALARTIDQSCQARRADIAHRREPITGVSAFPNIHEQPIGESGMDLSWEGSPSQDHSQPRVFSTDTQPDEAAIDQALTRIGEDRVSSVMAAARAGASMERLTASIAGIGAPDRIDPWPCHRLAADFEALRDISDAVLAAEGQRPCVFLANLGSIASHTARATFAKNFFEAGGFEALTNDGFETPDQAVAALSKSPARIVCLCGHDDLYAEQAALVAQALKQAGAEMICLAGRPKERRHSDAEAGIELYIYEGCDMVTILTGLYQHLGLSS